MRHVKQAIKAGPVLAGVALACLGRIRKVQATLLSAVFGRSSVALNRIGDVAAFALVVGLRALLVVMGLSRVCVRYFWQRLV